MHPSLLVLVSTGALILIVVVGFHSSTLLAQTNPLATYQQQIEQIPQEEEISSTSNARRTRRQQPASRPLSRARSSPAATRSDWFKFLPSEGSSSSSRGTRQLPPRTAALQSSSSSKCALILQRTYVKKSSAEPDDPSNSIEGEPQLEPTGKKERICITYNDINKAIGEAKQRRAFGSVPAEEVNSIEPRVPIIAELGELNQEVTRILALRFDLSPDEILNGLALVDMSRTDFWPLCPLMVRPVECDPTGRFRSFTGHCNNLNHPAWGAAQTPFVRYLAPRHPDGIQAERASSLDGSRLPSPRLVTSMVHRDHDQPSADLSLMIMVWGQIIDHDVALAAPPRG